MVASKSDNGEDEVVKCIKDSSSLIRQTVTSIDDTIQDTLDSIKDQIQMEYTVIPYFFKKMLQWRKQAQGVLIFQNTFFVCRREYARIYSKPSKHGW